MGLKTRSNSNALPQLGELELALMQALWKTPGQDVKQLHAQISVESGNTGVKSVQSALERLFRKSLVAREKSGRAFVYTAHVGRGELLGRLIGGVIRQLHSGSLAPILSGFVDFADQMSDASLDELERLVLERKRQHQEQAPQEPRDPYLRRLPHD